MWVALVAAAICMAVMFLINWYAALITIALVAALYMYVHYTKPGKWTLYSGHVVAEWSSSPDPSSGVI